MGHRAARRRSTVAPGWHTAPATSTARSTTPSRCSWSSSWRWRRRGRSSASPSRRCAASPARAASTPAAWWATILIVGPLLGSFITEPAAMTICALLLARQFYDLQPVAATEVRDAGPAVRQRLDRRHADAFRRAAGVDGGAACGTGTRRSCCAHFGWRAVVGHRRLGRRLLPALPPRAGRARRASRRRADVERARGRRRRGDAAAAGAGVDHASCTCLFMAWTVFTAHYPALFVGGFLFFLGFARATAPYQSRVELKAPLLVGFFLAGLVIHGGLQGWWIAPVLASLGETPLFCGATRPDGLQRQRADHLSGDAGAEPERRHEGRGRGRRGHRRRPDGDRQRARTRPGRRCSAGSSTARCRRCGSSPARCCRRSWPRSPSGCYERRARLDRDGQRGHRHRAAGAGLQRRRRRARAGLGRLAAVRQRHLQQRQRPARSCSASRRSAAAAATCTSAGC